MTHNYSVETFGDWVVRLRIPELLDGCPVLLLLHGLTGNENSMWAFEKLLPEDAFVIAPRGLYPSGVEGMGGFSWVEGLSQLAFLPTARDLIPAAYRLNDLIAKIGNIYSTVNMEHLDIIGFSQGAAMGMAFSCEFPEKISKLALLAGFLPDNLAGIAGKQANFSVYIGHGENDEVVPVENAQTVKSFWEAQGRAVTYCLSPTGHRLGVECASGLERFLTN